MSGEGAESWEQLKLEELKISEPVANGEAAAPVAAPAGAPQVPAPAQQDNKPGVSATSGAQAAPAEPLLTSMEVPILTALVDVKERATVLRIEEDVLRFINDHSRDALEFPNSFTNYQRMLAHKVAQYHNLATSTVDYEGSAARVVAHRRATVQEKPRPRLADLDVTSEAATALLSTAAKGSPQDRPKLLRRPSGHDAMRGPGMDPMKGHQGPPNARSVQDRLEEYNRARERIIGGADLGAAGGRGMGRGMGPGGRGIGPPGAMMAGGNGANQAGRGRGRKGGFRDRSAELQQDPDYMRGMGRYPVPPPGNVYDPNTGVYMQPPPMYGAMYPPPELNRAMSGGSIPQSPKSGPGQPGYSPSGPSPSGPQPWGAQPPHGPPGGAGAYKQPPPPPPPSGGGSGAGPKSTGANSYPTTPTASSSHGGQAPPPPPPGHMPGAMQARPYGMQPMPGYPMGMGYPAAGMPGGMPAQAMYGAPAYPYAMAPGGYGYIAAAVPGQEGAAGGMPMYGAPAYPYAMPGAPMVAPMFPGAMQPGMARGPMPPPVYGGMPGYGAPGGMPGGEMQPYPMQYPMQPYPMQQGQGQGHYGQQQQHNNGPHGRESSGQHHGNYGNGGGGGRGSRANSSHQAPAPAGAHANNHAGSHDAHVAGGAPPPPPAPPAAAPPAAAAPAPAAAQNEEGKEK